MHDCEVQISDYGKADVAALADIHRSAFEGYMNAGVGRGYVRQLLRWFLNRSDAIGLQATIDGQPCGYVIGMPLGEHRQLNRDLMLAAATGVATHPWVLLEKRYRKSAAAKIKRVLGLDKPAPEPSKPEPAPSESGAGEYDGRGIGLFSIAVASEFSGKGAGAAMVNAFEDRARQLGYEFVQLSVYTDNARARAVYEKAGWDLCEQIGATVLYRKKLASTATSP